MIKFVSRLLNTSAADKQFIKKEPDHLIVGKEDKAIGIMSDGEIIPLLTPMLNLLNNQQGNVKIPTDSGFIMVQWGQSSLQADSSQTFSFAEPFPNNCFQIIGSHKNDDHPVQVSIESTSRTQYAVSITGGSGGENVSWIAIGN